jgi:uncharacterized protein
MRTYLEWLLRHRIAVIVACLLVTAVAALQVKNLKIVIDPNKVLPQSHPYVVTSNLVEKVFGSKYVAVIGITPKEGDIFQAPVLEKVQNITAGLMKTPGVVKENLLSLSARRAKNIAGSAEGMEVKPLMVSVPKTAKQMDALRQALTNNPVYLGSIVSDDRKTTAILAEFKEGTEGFRAVMSKIEAVVSTQRDPSVSIAIGGLPAFLAPIETFSERINILFPLAVFVVGLIHLEAFRTIQGLLLPLVTALLAVAWGAGLMGFVGIPLDTFNAATPVLILAVAAGHAVQLLKRYYDEYDQIRTIERLPPQQANQKAVIESVMKVGPVMITAGGIAAIGFFSLIVFEIASVRTFGVFTGIGILSALILEMTFTPALRSLLPPPGKPKKRKRSKHYDIWDRVTLTIARWVLTRASRLNIYWGAALIVAVALLGMTRVVMDNSTKNFFSDNLAFREDDRVLNERLSGTNNFYVLVQGRDEDAIKDPKVLQAMDETERFVERESYVGKAVSIADFLKRMNQAMNGDDPKSYGVPESRELVSQYLLLYSMSGEPGDFDSYVDYNYRQANITVFLKTDSSAYLQELIPKVKAFMAARLPHGVSVSIGGSVPQGAALNEVMVHSKILNIVQIAGVVFIVSALVFRSLIAGLLILLPLLMAVIVNFGVMGWSGMLLNVPTSLCSAMAVGIGADYAIYLIYRLREELAHGLGEHAAVIEVLRSAGKASLFVASAVAGGYAVLFFSFGFHVHQWLAALICTAMLVSVIAALTLIPSLIVTFRPRFVFAGAAALHPARARDGGWMANLGRLAAAKWESFRKLKL